MSDIANTPMMKQYSDIRKKLPSKTLLFFRLGDFYEMFNEDAIVGAKILGLTLTHRGTAPMVGVPYHAAANYTERLLKNGYKVAICDQLTPAKPGQLVTRALSRILSPGTIITDEASSAQENHYILAINVNRKEIMMAWAEASTGEFQVAYSTDIQRLFNVAYAIRPSEIIIPENAQNRWQSLDTSIVESLRELFHDRSLSELPEFYFDKVHGANIVKETLGVLTFDGYGLRNDELPALGPAGALLQYISENFCQKPRNIRSMRVYRPQSCMIIDRSAIINLEIFQSLSGQKTGSLYQAIDYTVTASGARLVERYLMAPCLDRMEILRRQHCVRGFVESPDICMSLRRVLRNVHDISRILTRLQNRIRCPRDLQGIRVTLEMIPEVQTLLKEQQSPELVAYAKALSSCDDLRQLLALSLADDVPNAANEGGFIREGFDAKLDEYRDLFLHGKNWIEKFEQEEQQKTGIKNLKVKSNNTFGYYIEVTKSNLKLVPERYIRRQTTVNAERFITQELKQKETEIAHAETLAIELEQSLLEMLIQKTLENFDILSQNAQILSELDVYAGWGTLAKDYHYCQPEITTEDRLEIKEGRHPVVEQMLADDKIETATNASFIPNDLNMSSGRDQIALITGPNMAGKSTYIRQVALIVILAHIGCWVPAQKSCISLVDKIFSRIGAGDNLARGHSTFMMEMTEVANILNNVSDASLVILDEVGRGTSTYDGLSIAWAVVEKIHGKGNRGPKTLFATHYHELTQLERSLPRLHNFQVAVKEHHDEIVFLRKVVAGAADRSYGINVAKLAGIPKDVISRSQEVLKELETEGNIFVHHLRQKQRKPRQDSFQIDLL